MICTVYFNVWHLVFLKTPDTPVVNGTIFGSHNVMPIVLVFLCKYIGKTHSARILQWDKQPGGMT